MALAATLALAIAAAQLFPKRDKKEDPSRSIEGTVLNPDDQPVTGAVVQLKNQRTLQVRSYITKEGGKFGFYGLDPNTDFAVRAEADGLSSPWRNVSVFDSRKKILLTIRLEKGEKQEKEP
jgi:hypothetical protein